MSLRSIFSRNSSRSTSGRNANANTSAHSGQTVTRSPPPSYRSPGYTASATSYDESALPQPPSSSSHSRQRNSRSSRASIAESTASSSSLASSTTVTGGANGIKLLTMYYMEQRVLTQCVDQYEVCFTSSALSLLLVMHSWMLTSDHRKSRALLASYSISPKWSRYSSM
jgi:hypothetical protein